MRAALTHPASKLSKTSVVIYDFMYSHKDMNVNKFRIPTTKHFIKGEKCEISKG